MDEEQINQLKVECATQKDIVTTTARRLHRSYGTQPERLLNSYYDKLEEAYYSFLDLDSVINGPNCSGCYTKEVADIYTTTKQSFYSYFRDQAKDEVLGLQNELETTLDEIIKEEDKNWIMVKRDSLHDFTTLVVTAGKKRGYRCADADWGEVDDAVKKVLERRKEVQEIANLKLSGKILITSEAKTPPKVLPSLSTSSTISPDNQSPPGAVASDLPTPTQATSSSSNHSTSPILHYQPPVGSIYTSVSYSQPPLISPAQLLLTQCQYISSSSSGAGLQPVMVDPVDGCISTSHGVSPTVAQLSPNFHQTLSDHQEPDLDGAKPTTSTCTSAYDQPSVQDLDGSSHSSVFDGVRETGVVSEGLKREAYLKQIDISSKFSSTSSAETPTTMHPVLDEVTTFSISQEDPANSDCVKATSQLSPSAEVSVSVSSSDSMKEPAPSNLLVLGSYSLPVIQETLPETPSSIPNSMSLPGTRQTTSDALCTPNFDAQVVSNFVRSVTSADTGGHYVTDTTTPLPRSYYRFELPTTKAADSTKVTGVGGAGCGQSYVSTHGFSPGIMTATVLIILLLLH